MEIIMSASSFSMACCLLVAASSITGCVASVEPAGDPEASEGVSADFDENLGEAMQLSARPDVRVGIVEPNTALPNGRQRAPTG